MVWGWVVVGTSNSPSLPYVPHHFFKAFFTMLVGLSMAGE